MIRSATIKDNPKRMPPQSVPKKKEDKRFARKLGSEATFLQYCANLIKYFIVYLLVGTRKTIWN